MFSILGYRHDKNWEKFFRKFLKRSDEKRTGNGTCPFFEWKSFFGIQVTWSNHFMISAIVDTW